jgi:hypothetical protein
MSSADRLRGDEAGVCSRSIGETDAGDGDCDMAMSHIAASMSSDGGGRVSDPDVTFVSEVKRRVGAAPQADIFVGYPTIIVLWKGGMAAGPRRDTESTRVLGQS